MRIVDAYPSTALTTFGGRATVVVEVERAGGDGSGFGASGSAPDSEALVRCLLRVELMDLTTVVVAVEQEVLVSQGVSEHRVPVRVPVADPDVRQSPAASSRSATRHAAVAARGYHVKVSVAPLGGPLGGPLDGQVEPAERLTAATALLVADHWRHAPRYGFLSEFAPEDDAGSTAGAERVKHLAKHHITIVQFYDWMYRHYQLLPPTDTYRDALDRELSLTTVRGRIAACHDHGMAALAYGSVYGPEPEFILQRPDWLLYDSGGAPISLIDLFYITDLRAGSAWREHILREFERAVASLPMPPGRMRNASLRSSISPLFRGRR